MSNTSIYAAVVNWCCFVRYILLPSLYFVWPFVRKLWHISCLSIHCWVAYGTDRRTDRVQCVIRSLNVRSHNKSGARTNMWSVGFVRVKTVICAIVTLTFDIKMATPVIRPQDILQLNLNFLWSHTSVLWMSEWMNGDFISVWSKTSWEPV